jgi:hypothetical protein
LIDSGLDRIVDERVGVEKDWQDRRDRVSDQLGGSGCAEPEPERDGTT